MLYIVGTPLGNVEDMSLRGARTLSEVDVILVEDTRTFQSFYKHICTAFNLQPSKGQKIISYHDQNEFKQAPYVLKMLQTNKKIALVSEAGMPLISDPGTLLVKEAIKNNYEVTCIPGPTAFTNAAVLSGMNIDNLLFIGFLPKKESEKNKVFVSLHTIRQNMKSLTICFYESPHRIEATLALVNTAFPKAEMCIARELTKKFEEISRGTAIELSGREYKGELTVVLDLK
jgi:16S rRNA (cytidine1402-2'-O)-methyltransferase